MKHIVAGTAGHIDHGKTALVRALTGIDTDRLAEEKRRGISIDLGFAHADLAENLRIAFVDVPGHEKFIKNMLAGATGIDLVLFIIAADESIKPQTREHFEICRLLRVKRGIIVLTKADLVDEDLLGLVKLEVEEFVSGSFLEGAPIIPVSSVTNQGIARLREELIVLAGEVQQRDESDYLRLPLDRSFIMKGFGTVVTGTLIAGTASLEQEVEVHPGARLLRIRGIQVHGRPAKKARAGQRTAINIAGADHSELRRGMVIAEKGRFRATRQVDCRFELLSGAHPLKHRAPVHFHIGTAEVEAEVRLLESAGPMKPGSSGYVRFRLREPVLALPGDRFIVRMFSPVVTIGGGEILDTMADARIRGTRAAERLKRLEAGALPDRIALLVQESGFGMTIPDLVARTGATAASIQSAIPSDRITVLKQPGPWLIDKDFVEATLDRWRTQLAEFHKANRLLPGVAKEELRSRELSKAPAFLLDALLSTDPRIVSANDTIRLSTHKLALEGDEEQAISKIESAFRERGLAVPSMQEVIAGCGVDPVRGRSLLQILLRDRRLVKIGDDLVYHHTALATLRQLLAAHKGERFAVPVFKDWTGVSRKYAIPLLEYLDRERVTRRDGDSRVVL
jgi:selenocysteine-specific elongation factor